MAYYVLDENKNLVQSFDREGFLAILEQAIEQGSLENIDEDSAVASKLRSTINGTAHHIEFVTSAQYSQMEAQSALVVGTYYFITDDTSLDDLEEAIVGIQSDVSGLDRRATALETQTTGIQSDVSGLDRRATALETQTTAFNNKLSMNGNPISWTKYDTSERDIVPSGLYVCNVIKADEHMNDRDFSTVIIFVSDKMDQRDSSACFVSVDWSSGDDVYCNLVAKRQTATGKIFAVETSDGDLGAYYVYAHKIGDAL